MSIGNAATMLGVCTKTLRRWDEAGVFRPSFRTKGNHRRYERRRVLEMMKTREHHEGMRKLGMENTVPRAMVYGRVSSSRQKKSGELRRQIEVLKEYCASKKYRTVKSVSDVGSGVNDNRKGLLALLRDVSRGKCDVVVANYNDRLSRFGMGIIREFMASWGVNLEIINPTVVENTPHAELITDLTAIMYSFMGKLYRMRRKPNEKKIAPELKQEKIKT